MELYGQKDRSIAQKATIIILELVLLWLSYRILFGTDGILILNKLGFEINGMVAMLARRKIIFIFSLIVFLRLGFMMLCLLKRKIPWEESLSVPFAFALYYIGFAFFVLTTTKPIDLIDYLAVFIFVLGSYLNTYSELQRHFWKKNPENKGKLYTQGFFKYSMHINYFGDLLWVTAYAVITRNGYAVSIPLFLFCFFAFYNIPKLDAYLADKYHADFEDYRKKTKKFIPFIY